MHSVLGLVPRTSGEPFLLLSLTHFPSGLCLADASFRQPTMITPLHILTVGPWLCSPPHCVISCDKYLVSFCPPPCPASPSLSFPSHWTGQQDPSLPT